MYISQRQSDYTTKRVSNFAEEPSLSLGYSFEEWLDSLLDQIDNGDLPTGYSFAKDYNDCLTPSQTIDRLHGMDIW